MSGISFRRFIGQHSMTTVKQSQGQPYPEFWEDVAELRVFRTTPEHWQSLIGWRTEMKSKGWKLLRVTELGGEMMAVFGRTREELLSRNQASPP